jgi:hypothetical protein
MVVKVNLLGLLLLQEVGFDIVSMWGRVGYLGKAVVLVIGIVFAWVIGAVINQALSSISARRKSRDG